VLHVFGSMNRGGAETRTLEIMRRLRADEYRFDFCVLSGHPGTYAAEIEALGGRVLPCAIEPRTLSFPGRFLTVLRRGGYDVVHSHVHQFSGLILLLARLARVPTRIAHIRNAHDGHPDTLGRRAYRAAMRRLLDATATTVIGVSEAAMEAFWGEDWRAEHTRVVIYNGIDVARFQSDTDATAVREELGVPPRAPLVAHVGNFSPAKNHGALITIAQALVARRPDVVFLLVGDGPARAAIEAEVSAWGLAGVFRFAGPRADVARLLRAADVFVLPSKWEGLPGVVLEALAAALPVVASPIPPVLEIARHAPSIVTCDPARPEDFARAIDAALAGAPRESTRGRSSLPPAFALEDSMRRLLACYQ
jgi:glycosyltransferase involved in cell wall biosynthesis